MTDDDWQPLPPELVVGHPGEFAVVDKRQAVAAPASKPADEPASKPARQRPNTPPAPPDANAERALQALAAKLAAAPPARSLIACAQHRQQKVLRQQAAAAQPDLAATIVTAAPPTEPAPVVAYAAGPNSRDEREDSEWFLALPIKERERLAAVWRAERERFTREPELRHKRLQRAAAHGACVFFIVGLLAAFLTGSWSVIAKLTIAGSIAGLLAAVCGGGRIRYAIAGAATSLLVLGSAVIGNPFLLYLLLASAYGMAAVGMEVEMRRSGGFRDA